MFVHAGHNVGRLDPSQERCQEPFLRSVPFFAPVSLRWRALRARILLLKKNDKKKSLAPRKATSSFCLFFDLCLFLLLAVSAGLTG